MSSMNKFVTLLISFILLGLVNISITTPAVAAATTDTVENPNNVVPLIDQRDRVNAAVSLCVANVSATVGVGGVNTTTSPPRLCCTALVEIAQYVRRAGRTAACKLVTSNLNFSLGLLASVNGINIQPIISTLSNLPIQCLVNPQIPISHIAIC